MPKGTFFWCAPGTSGCFLQADSLPVENDFCQSETDKRLCNFGACYNCFFVGIPLKEDCSTGGKPSGKREF